MSVQTVSENPLRSRPTIAACFFVHHLVKERREQSAVRVRCVYSANISALLQECLVPEHPQWNNFNPGQKPDFQKHRLEVRLTPNPWKNCSDHECVDVGQDVGSGHPSWIERESCSSSRLKMFRQEKIVEISPCWVRVDRKGMPFQDRYVQALGRAGR